ncbi:hypothetical protein ACFOY4_39775 [Actinomadura syzygii]|uniref:Uncharacterized protein n=1 Tax=Actinomadura syzygii TaxID=1427538 RepID=A0A5D0U829_9ACTN|nr:hypothetical protein [Actinomadura syzygii]TYC14498.1 hypothetical protein FXF65_16765 [Actinomadura syzygii]
MGRQPFSCPFFLAVGLRAEPGEPEAELRALADFYDSVHLDEVVRLNEGFVSAARYEVIDPVDDEGVPHWLAVYGIGDEQSARDFLKRERPVYMAGPGAWQRATAVWRMVWENTGSVGAADVDPGRMSMIGMDPATDATAAEIAEFDDFYTGVHLPEILPRFGYDRGSRFRLWHEFIHPAPGAPRYNAIYEADDPEPKPPSGEPLTPGPRAWEERQVRWRVKFRRAS